MTNGDDLASWKEVEPFGNDEEQDELGNPTGVERELPLNQAEPRIDQPFDPDTIDVATRNPTVDLLLSRVRSGMIDLQPDFQRRGGIWTDQRQSRLIESLLLRIPLPTLYAAEDEEERWAIVDGIQRLTAIARFIEPTPLGLAPLQLCGLEYLGAHYNGAPYGALPGRLQTRLRETELVLHVIRKGTPDEVKYNIFARINTGGMPLSAQELRHALISGPIRDRLRALAESEEFVRATDGSIRDTRMADREMVLRFIAFRLTPGREYAAKDFDDFLRRAMKRSNSLMPDEWKKIEEEFFSSMAAAFEIFGRRAYRKIYSASGPRHPINKALFDTVSSGLADLSQNERLDLIARRGAVEDGLVALMNTQSFQNSISQATGDIAKVRLRFKKIEQLFRSVLSA